MGIGVRKGKNLISESPDSLGRKTRYLQVNLRINLAKSIGLLNTYLLCILGIVKLFKHFEAG